MFTLKKSHLALLVGCISLFAGCAKNTHLKRLKNLESVKGIVAEKDKVTVGAHALTKKESQRFFGTSFKKYQPIQLIIINGTQQRYNFNPECINLPLANIEKINKEISRPIKVTKAIPIFLTICLGIPLIGTLAFGALGAILAAGTSYGIASAALAAGALGTEILLVCGTTLACEKIDTVASKTKRNVYNKSLSYEKNLIIKPEEEVNVFFFVERKNMKDTFSLQLIDGKDLDSLRFRINL